MQLPRGDVPNPIAPQTWHFRQSIDYSVTNNYAVLDLASKRKDDFLFNMYLMGRNAIERGSRDSWTMHPARIDAVSQDARGGRARADRRRRADRDSTSGCCAIRRRAIRAASSCRPTSPTF